MPRTLLHSLLAATLCLCAQAHAQTAWPDKPLKLMQGFGAGGNADTVARILAAPLSEFLGKPVVVEGKTGAGGNIASEAVAKSPADGYTLILLTGGHAVSAGLYKSLPFHPVDDFSMVTTATFFPFALGVRPDHPARTLAEFIRYARDNPGKVNFSSVGVGSTQHLTGELLASVAGIRMTHVPYRGGAAPLEGLLRGDVDLLVDTVTFTSGQIKAGKVRALGVTNPQPWALLPGVAPVAETLPGFDVRSWTGIAAPRGTPAPVIERLNRELRRVLALPEVKARLEGLGNEVRGGSPEEMRAHVASEAARWTQVIRAAGIPQQ